jgi:DNA-binding PadR family transcriptional regulator
MGKGDFLGEFEQLVLIALIRVGEGAYRMTVRREIEERAGRDVSIGAVYATLDRLEEKRLVKSYAGEPSESRGNRGRKCFKITGAARVRVVTSAAQNHARAVRGVHAAVARGPRRVRCRWFCGRCASIAFARPPMISAARRPCNRSVPSPPRGVL